MMMGKPVVYSTHGAGPEVITDGESGLLCDPNRPADIARCLNAFLADADLAQRLGAAARARALAEFDKPRWTRENLALYETLAT